MVSAWKLSTFLLAASLVSGGNASAGPVVIAGIDTGGGCDSAAITYLQSTMQQTKDDSGTTPAWWGSLGKDGMFADCRFDSGIAAFASNPVLIHVFYQHGPRGRPNHYNVAWGQRDGSQVPVFSNQHELKVSEDHESTLDTFGTRIVKKDVYAFFRVQSCGVFGFHSQCVPWSEEPMVMIHLGPRELTAY